MRTYRNMKSRVLGVQWRKAHLYLGLPLLPKEDFYSWANSDPNFHTLFEIWTASGYERRLTPSVNRIRPSQGYVSGNIEWITHAENSAYRAA